MVRRILVSVAIVLLILAAIATVWYRMVFPALPKVEVKQINYLEQGWTPDQREKYYQTPQGSLIMPTQLGATNWPL